MRPIRAFAIAGLMLTAAVHPVLADDQQIAFDACYKQLTRSVGVENDLAKKFSIKHITGNQYEMTGYNQNHQFVSCKTNNGRVTWVKVG